MDQFTADYLANLTADLTARVLEAALALDTDNAKTPRCQAAKKGKK